MSNKEDIIGGYLEDIARHSDLYSNNIDKIISASKQSLNCDIAKIAFLHWYTVMDVSGVDTRFRVDRLPMIEAEIAMFIDIKIMGYFISWCDQAIEYFDNYLFGMKNPNPYDIFIEIYQYLDPSFSSSIKENRKIIDAMHLMAIAIKNKSLLNYALNYSS